MKINTVTKKEYIENISGFSIKSMDINDREVYLLTLVEEPDLSDNKLPLEKKLAREGDFIYRFLNFKLEPKHAFSFMETAPSFVNRALSIFSKKSGWISVDFNGNAWEVDVDDLIKWPGYSIQQTDAYQLTERKSIRKTKKTINAPAGLTGGWLSYINELKEIDGSIYACGGIRKVLKREGYKKWVDITLHKDHPQLHQEMIDVAINGNQSKVPSSFKSVDGFSAKDIYACGSDGDCWHYDGKTWKHIDIPTNKELNKIVCTEEGVVYIASRDGLIIKGRDACNEQPESWKLLQSDIKALNGQPFEGATWFQSKLYVSTSYALYVLNDEELERMDFGDNHQFSFQNVVSNKNLLLSYGPYDALTFDGDTWKTIISSRVSE